MTQQTVWPCTHYHAHATARDAQICEELHQCFEALCTENEALKKTNSDLRSRLDDVNRIAFDGSVGSANLALAMIRDHLMTYYPQQVSA